MLNLAAYDSGRRDFAHAVIALAQLLAATTEQAMLRTLQLPMDE